jgi:hypothetical protein
MFLQFFITLAIIFFYHTSTSAADIFFLISLFLCNAQRMVKLRFPYLIASGILIPLVLSHAVLPLWLEQGTANANYFFFQMLIMWTFIAVLIIEYTRATLESIRQKFNVGTETGA